MTKVEKNNAQEVCKVYDYENLREEMKKGNSVMAINGKVYDVTKFIDKHPGGAIIRTGFGRDATILFETHHNLLDQKKVNAVLEKYLVGEIKDYKPPAKFDSPFATTLLKRCREAAKDMPHRDSLYSTSAYITYYIGFIVLIYLSFTIQSLWLTPIMGLWMALGHTAGHAGNHWSLSSNETMSRFLSLTCTNLWGLYEKNWEFSHVISHHCYNYTDRDYILEQHVPTSYYRVRDCDPWKPIHAYQHRFYQITFLISFCVGALRLDCFPWIILSPFLRSLRRNTDSDFPAPQFFAAGPNIPSVDLLTPKEDGVGPQKFFIFYENFDHLCSLLMANIIWLPLFITLARTHGILYATLFNSICFGVQASYVCRALLLQHMCEGIQLKKDYDENDDWYALQVAACTTVHNNPISLWMAFGSSYQTEHHLFPCANPAVLMKLQPIVQQTAKEFNVPYHWFPSPSVASKSVYKHLLQLSICPKTE